MAAPKPLPDMTAADIARFWARVNKRATDECWLWTSDRSPKGYGILVRKISGRVQRIRAHRISFSLAHGDLQLDKELDHLCRNRACVNPAHLEMVTRAENIRRGTSISAENGRKTHCLNGHPFDSIGSRGCRQCSTCHRARTAQSKARRKVA